MFFATRTGAIALLIVTLLYACGPCQAPRTPKGAEGALSFVVAYNAYVLAQTYLENGRRAEAIVEYERSLREFNRLDDAARARLQNEYGLSREQVEKELSAARVLTP
jgi:hypothetical protein